MFEKEAVDKITQQFGTSGEYNTRIRIWQDGAEFGFQKGIKAKINTTTISDCPFKDEWHYVKDGDYPKEEGSYYVAMTNDSGYKYSAILNWVEETDCEEDFHWEDDDFECFDEQVYAWRECPVLPPKE